jgi:acetyl-CoA synthetase
VIVADDAFMAGLSRYPSTFKPVTRGDDYAIYQYTSGTTRELPEAVKHTHRSIVTLMLAALYGTGLRPGDRFFCPSSPAWGHGLWHGTLAPLALGITIGAFSGKFNAERLLKALHDHRFTNLSAAATHYRMMRNSGAVAKYTYFLEKLSFTGEPIDSETASFAEQTFGHPVCSMYGTTEIGVILVSYPGAEDFVVKPGSLGKPIPGGKVEVQDANGKPCPPGVTGELKVWRRDAWIPTKDLGRVDSDGYFYHGGRADDVIISAGWTMSAIEIEDAILKHPDVQEAAAIGVPDALRGQVVKGIRRRQARRRRRAGRGNPGAGPDRLECARIPAACRVRQRTAEDTGGQGTPEGPARARAGRAGCRRRCRPLLIVRGDARC